MSRMSRSSTLALWAAVFSLLLKTAVPLLAATAAALRGVPVASVCAIYGVAMPAVQDVGGAAAHAGHGGHTEHAGAAGHAGVAEHAGLGEQAGPAELAGHAEHGGHGTHAEHLAHVGPHEPPAHAVHGSSVADARPAGPAHGVLHALAGRADPSSHPSDHTHADDKHGAGHCALTALAALAVPDAAIADVPRVHDTAPDRESTRAVAFHDASAAWIARLKHGPPAAA